jgi:hypothetical protein
MVMDTLILGRKRQKVSRANPFSTRQNLSALILEAVRIIFHLNIILSEARSPTS